MSWPAAAKDRDDAGMQLLDDLRREHDLIDCLLSSLRSFAAKLVDGAAPSADGVAIIECLESYAGGWHHEREEHVLFDALATILPADRGPIAVMLADHHALAKSLASMRAALAADDASAFETLTSDYTRMLWAHIDVENSVLFPESEIQLRRSGIRELPSLPPPEATNGIVERAQELIAKYPGADAADVIRGEGCVMCPSYGDTCSGLEREWWNEWQWEELDEHVASS